jgi:hypothetical protein
MSGLKDPWHFARPELAKAYLTSFDLGLTASRIPNSRPGSPPGAPSTSRRPLMHYAPRRRRHPAAANKPSVPTITG